MLLHQLTVPAVGPVPDRPGLGLTCRSPVDGAGVHGDVLLWQGRRVLGDDVRTLITPEVTVGRNPLEVYGPGTSSGQGSHPLPDVHSQRRGLGSWAST